MQLSSKARKAVAAGLALSTILWGTMLFALPVASAAAHSEGCVVLSGGVVYLIQNGARRGFTSAEVFASSGYNFSQVVSATAEDNTMPVGPIMTYADGTLVKGPNDPLVYLVAAGQKRPFVSGAVFTGLSYSFANIQQAPVNTFQDLPTGSNLDNATIAHPAGTLVNSNGTIYLMTTTGKKGIPSMDVFNSYGYKFAKVVAGNAADAASNNEGTLTARVLNCSSSTPVVTNGNVNVSFAGPASSVLILNQGNAKLADFTFSGYGTVTNVNLKRIGVSADDHITSVYLYDGATRLTDGASVTTGGAINFSNTAGLFTVNGSKTISVLADITGAAGETMGVQLTGITLASGTVGGLPVSGNLHTFASADLATVAFAAATATGDVDPGENINVWQSTVTVGTRDVTMTRLALRQIGSINASDIRNFELFIDGTSVATVANLDSNGYATFVFNKTLKTGARVLRVEADVIGGSSRTVQMSLQGAYDVAVSDTNYGANITSTGTFAVQPSSFTVNSGTMTTFKATDSPSQNVTIGATDIPLAKYTMTAYGERVKVENLKVGIIPTTTGDATNLTLRNVRILVNGGQLGSTTNVPAAASYAANTGTQFNTNFYVDPGTPTIVEIRGDMVDSEDNGADNDDIAAGTVTKVQAVLVGGAGRQNGVPQVSITRINVPSDTNVAGNALTIGSGSLSLAALGSYPAQTTTVPQQSFKLGAWKLDGSNNEAVNLNTFEIDFTGADAFAAADLTNVFLKYGDKTSAIKGTVSTSDNTWSVSSLLAKNDSMTVELWGTISSGATDGDGVADTMQAALTVTGTADVSGNTLYADADTSNTTKDAGVSGQVITVGSGSITATLDASSPTARLVDDSGTVTTAAFLLKADTDTYTVTDITITMGTGADTVTSGVVLKDGSTVVGTAKVGTTITWSGLNIVVPANGDGKVITVEATMLPVGNMAGTTDSSLKTTLTSFTATNSAGVSAAGTESNPAGADMYVYKALPTITGNALTAAEATLHAGTNQTIARFTVSTNGTGTIAWKEALFEVSKTTTPALSNYALYDSDGNQITAAILVQNSSEGADTDIDGSDTSGELVVTIGTKADDDVVEAVSSSKTYELRADIAGAIGDTDNLSVKLDRNTTTHAASAVFTTNDAATTANSTSFTWSDESNALTRNTGVATWQKDYLVKNLPISWNMN